MSITRTSNTTMKNKNDEKDRGGEPVQHRNILPSTPSKEESVASGRPAPQAGSRPHAESTQGSEHQPGSERMLPSNASIGHPAYSGATAQGSKQIPPPSGGGSSYQYFNYGAYSQSSYWQGGQQYTTYDAGTQIPPSGAAGPQTGFVGSQAPAQSSLYPNSQHLYPTSQGPYTSFGSGHPQQYHEQADYGGYCPNQYQGHGSYGDYRYYYQPPAEQQWNNRQTRRSTGRSGAVNPGPPIQRGQHRRGPEGANLFIFHIPNEWSNMDLFNLFSPYGNIMSAKIMTEHDTGRGRGFAFVSYDSAESAEAAIRSLDGYEIGQKHLKVSHKRPEQNDLSQQPPFPSQHARAVRGSRSTHTSERQTKRQPFSSVPRYGYAQPTGFLPVPQYEMHSASGPSPGNLGPPSAGMSSGATPLSGGNVAKYNHVVHQAPTSGEAGNSSLKKQEEKVANANMSGAREAILNMLGIEDVQRMPADGLAAPIRHDDSSSDLAAEELAALNLQDETSSEDHDVEDDRKLPAELSKIN